MLMKLMETSGLKWFIVITLKGGSFFTTLWDNLYGDCEGISEG